jgi:hypothetical protein
MSRTRFQGHVNGRTFSVGGVDYGVDLCVRATGFTVVAPSNDLTVLNDNGADRRVGAGETKSLFSLGNCFAHEAFVISSLGRHPI